MAREYAKGHDADAARVIDARFESQPHDCRSTWRYAGLNGGGHDTGGAR
jgi:hypothetical protein